MELIYKIVLILALVLMFAFYFYATFPLPYILQSQFWSSSEFAWLVTIMSGILILSSIINNVLLILILKRTPKVYGVVSYLLVMMCFADMVYPLCHLPFIVIYCWIQQESTWRYFDFYILLECARIFTAVYYYMLGIGATSFMLACLTRAYTTIFKAFDHVEFKYKFSTGILSILCCSVILFISLKYTDTSKWAHMLFCILVAYIPVLLSSIGLAITTWYRKFRQIYKFKRNLNYVGLYAMLGLYLVFWLPMFTVTNIHVYHTKIAHVYYSKLTYILPMLVNIKSSLNLIVLVSSDKRLQSALIRLLYRGKCSTRREGNINNNNLSYHGFPVWSEMKELHLSGSRIDMYSDNTADTNELIQENLLEAMM